MRTIFNNPKISELESLEEKIMEILLDGKERNVNALFREVKKLNYNSKKIFLKRLRSLEKKGLIYFVPSPKHKRAKIVKPVPLVEEACRQIMDFKYTAYNYMVLTYLELAKEKDKKKIYEKLQECWSQISRAFSRILLNIHLDDNYRGEVKRFIFSLLMNSYGLMVLIFEKFRENFLSTEDILKIIEEEKLKDKSKFTKKEIKESREKFNKLRNKLFREFEKLWDRFWFEVKEGRRDLYRRLNAPAGI